MVRPGPIAVHTPHELAEQQEGLVAELRRCSPRFVDLWESADLRPHEDTSRHKYIDHPAVGRIGVDCDVLVVAGDDLRIMVYSTEPDTEDAERLELAIVLGTQAFAQ